MPTAEQTIHSPAPATQAWALVADMSRMGEWVAPIRRVVLVPEDSGPGVGVVRRITTPVGFKLDEKIIAWEEGSAYTYVICGEPWPFENYQSEVRVEDHDQGCQITWRGQWDVRQGVLSRWMGRPTEVVMSRFYRGALRRAARRLRRPQ